MALVLTLAFLVMITTLVLGFTTSMRSDRAAALSHLEKTRAQFFAQAGIDSVTAKLRKHTIETEYTKIENGWDEASMSFLDKPVVTERNWISKPGELYVGKENDADLSDGDDRRMLQASPILLYSGQAASTQRGSSDADDPIYDAPELNIRTVSDLNSHLISNGDATVADPVPPEMKVAWVYVRQNGMIDPEASLDTTTAAAKQNPIVGRYAFWTDDECSKVNCNVAWGRRLENSFPVGHPSRMEFTGLAKVTENMSNAIRSFILSGRTDLAGPDLMKLPVNSHFFNSPDDVRRLGGFDPEISDALLRNRFEITHYNHDPGTSFFGDDRWLLTTNRNLVPHIKDPATGKIVYLRPFLDILRDDLPPDSEELDPGNMFHIEAGQYDFTCGYKSEAQGTNDFNPATGIQRLNGPPKPYVRRHKFDVVLRQLMAHLSRKDWPISPGKSFKDKFFPGTPDYSPRPSEVTLDRSRLTQVAMNIIAYVCAKESMAKPLGNMYGSSRPWPYSTSAGQIGTNSDKTDNAENPWGLTSAFGYRYLGDDNNYPAEYMFRTYLRTAAMQTAPACEAISRFPLITEMGMCMEKNPDPLMGNRYKVYLQVEIYLPEKYGFKDGINLVPDPSPNPSAGSLGWFLFFGEACKEYQFYKGGTNGDRLYYAPPDGRGSSLLSMRDYDPQFRIFRDDILNSGGDTWLRPGKRAVIQKIFYRNDPPTSRQYINMQTGLVLNHSSADGRVQRTLTTDVGGTTRSYHYAYGCKRPQRSPVYYKINVVDPLGVPVAGVDVIKSVAQMRSIEVNDPRTNLAQGSWVRNNTGNTFGAENSISRLRAKPAPTSYPQPDTDSAGNITDASLHMPPPAGVKISYADGSTDDNTLGRITSVAELGYVATGIDSLAGSTTSDGITPMVPGVTNLDYNVPWRTLRLQPNSSSDTDTLPDWALLDLFEVPQINGNRRIPNTAIPLVEDSVSDPSSEYYTPYGTMLRGKLNLNTHPAPFDTQRKGGLRALLTNARQTPTGPRMTINQAGVIADNIYDHALSPRDGFGNAGKSYGNAAILDSPGEICEIRGVADGGEESEALVREIVGLTSARGSVFTVYSVGQSLQQTPSGKLKVTAEQRQQAIVERYRDQAGTLSKLDDDENRIRTVYSRNLMP